MLPSKDLCEVACPGCGEKMGWPRGERVTESCDVCRASAEVRAVHLRNKSLAFEVVELRAALNSIVNEPVSTLLAQSAGLVRLVGPDDWPNDAIPREPVVVMAMRIKDAADKQRAIARAVLLNRPNDGRSGRCGIRISGDSWCILDHGHGGDHA